MHRQLRSHPPGPSAEDFLQFYDQTGNKIPIHLFPVTDHETVADWELTYEGLPDTIPVKTTTCPEKGEKHLLTSYFSRDKDIIPYQHVEGYVIHLGTTLVEGPFLHSVGISVICPYTEAALFPRIKTVGRDVLLQSAIQTDLSHLEKCGGRIDISMLTHSYLPNLKEVGEIAADTSESLHFPALQTANLITAPVCVRANLGQVPRTVAELPEN